MQFSIVHQSRVGARVFDLRVQVSPPRQSDCPLEMLTSYFGLDPVGTRVWELVAEPVSVSRLCDRLTSEFEVERATCERQTIDYLHQLLANGLLRIVDRSSGA